jgi:hypothetical protein
LRLPSSPDPFSPRPSNALAASNGNETIAAALSEISENLTSLVHDEIELAKAEVGQKVTSLAAGAAAVAAGAVFGIFALVFGLETIAWGADGIFVKGTGALFLGFLLVFVLLVLLGAGSAWFAWRKLRVGAPVPTMAIDEARKVRETVTTSGGTSGNDS